MEHSRQSFQVAVARSLAGLAALAALAGLAGCGSSAPLFLSDGRPTTQVQCPDSQTSCEQQARAACGGAFDTVRQSTDDGQRTLLYACKAK